MKFKYFAAVVLAAAASSNAAGQVPAQTPVSVANLIACRSNPDPDARLRCYDAMVTNFSQAVGSGAVVVLDREGMAKAKRELFGISQLRLGKLLGGDALPEEKELNATIRSATATGFAHWVLTLDTGARWRTTEPLVRQADPRPGQKVRIRRGTMGNYMLQIEGGRYTRAARVQ